MASVAEDLFDFSEGEISEVRNKFPKLTLLQKGFWEGEIDIDSTYEGFRIQDSFRVGIGASSRYPNELPIMVELGGRTESIAKKYALKDKKDLHYNPVTKIACLCVKQEEKKFFPPGSTLVTFIENLVTPYLFGLSYFEKQGHWPWGEYSHGVFGLLEYYAEGNEETVDTLQEAAKVILRDEQWIDFVKQIKKPSPDRFCICGSRKPIRKCHIKAWKGILVLRGQLERLKIDANLLYRR